MGKTSPYNQAALITACWGTPPEVTDTDVEASGHPQLRFSGPMNSWTHSMPALGATKELRRTTFPLVVEDRGSETCSDLPRVTQG